MLYKFLHESERSTLADMKKHFKAVPKTSLYSIIDFLWW